MKLERRLALALPFRDRICDRDQANAQPLLEGYLASPERVLQDLLQSRKLKRVTPGCFRYTPRPIQLAGFHLKPRVRLQVAWRAPNLHIQLLHYRLPGLEWLESRIGYGFQAEMIARHDGLDLSAIASLDLGEGGAGLRMPEPALRFLGDRLLALILERLRQRCLRHLPAAMERWAEQASDSTPMPLPRSA